MIKVIHWIANNPYLNLTVGLFLLYTGLYEAWESIADRFVGHEIGAHHGAAVFGIVHAFKSLSLIVKGTT